MYISFLTILLYFNSGNESLAFMLNPGWIFSPIPTCRTIELNLNIYLYWLLRQGLKKLGPVKVWIKAWIKDMGITVVYWTETLVDFEDFWGLL